MNCESSRPNLIIPLRNRRKGIDDGMHELPITENILNVVLRHAQSDNVRKVMTVHMRIGKLSDLTEEWLQRYFDYLSKGTVAEGAKLVIERTPVVVKCNACSTSYEINMTGMKEMLCPACGAKGGTLVSGREYHIKELEVI
jgi:hydrogenase nickel incorporation protein HypA/HybF